MKSIFKLFGIIGLMAIVGFSFSACSDGNTPPNLPIYINQTPSAADFNISGTGTTTYDGTAKTVTVTARAGKTSGEVTVKYNGSTTAPSAVSAYTVTFDVAAATGWKSASGLSAGKLIIFPIGGPLVLAHFMPWHGGPEYKSQETQSVYNGHWRGDNNWRDPTQVVGGDKSNIASQVYPLTGPYNGKSQHLLQYQVGLMKLAGIDGVLICWYGASSDYDGPFNQQISIAMADMITEANLKFSVVIEDWNTPGGPSSWPTNNSQTNINWLRDNWFNKDNYVKVGNRPLLLSFGPQGDLSNGSIINSYSPKPYFVDLMNKTAWADSTYLWPTPQQSNMNAYINNFYNNGKYPNSSYKVTSVFARFVDCYPWGSYGSIPDNNGATWEQVWTRAVESNPDVIQIATWNDFGEGTVIEPTREYGYRDLEYIQARTREWIPTFPFTAEDLRIPLEFYKLVYNQTASSEQNQAIQDAYSALWAGNRATFRAKATEAGVSVDMNDLKPIRR